MSDERYEPIHGVLADVVADAGLMGDLYRNLVEGFPGVLYLDEPTLDGACLYMSPSIVDLIGYRWDELPATVDRFFELVVHPDDREFVRECAARNRAGERIRVEYRCRTRSGAVKWILDDSAPVLDGRGAIVAIRGFFFDITDRKRAELEREVAEERYRGLLEDMPAILYVDAPDETGSTIYMSPQIEALLGYSLEEWKSEPDFFVEHILHPDDRERLLGEIADNNAGVSNRSEYRCLAKDGRVVWVFDESQPQFDEAGSVVATRGFMLDVTDRKRAELEREVAEERYRSLLEEMPATFYVASVVETGSPTYISPHVETMLGYSREEWKSEPDFFLRHIIHPDDRERVFAEIAENNAGLSNRSEYRCFAKDGRMVWVIDESQPQFDEARNVVAVHGFMLDVTDRKRAEMAREVAEERYRSLLEEMPAVFYVDAADEAGSTIYISPQIEALLGYSLEEWKSEPDFFVMRILHPDDRERVLEGIAQNNAGVSRHSEYRCIGKDGRVVWVVDESQPQFDEAGTVVATHGFMRDVTDRKEAEAELGVRDEQLRRAQRMESIGRLAGGIAHDFNNLLTVIRGHLDLLLGDEATPDEMRDQLGDVSVAADRATQLTRQLLAFSRQQVLKPTPLALDHVLRGLESMFSRLIPADIRLVVQAGTHLRTVVADRGQIEQVIANLVLNARDAMPEGGTLAVEILNRDLGDSDLDGVPAGAYVEVRVTDTGHGMDDETRARVFEPFFTTKGPGHGTGLGLATVEGIVAQSGGYLSLESAPGAGTTIGVLLPAADVVVEKPRGPTGRWARGGTETVLVVEDDHDVRQLVRRILEGLGYTVLEAADPGEALRIAADDSGLDLVLTDLVMPGGSGRSLAKDVGRLRPGLPVLLMSGYADDEIVRRGLVPETSAFLHKPFTRDELAAHVRQVLDARA